MLFSTCPPLSYNDNDRSYTCVKDGHYVCVVLVSYNHALTRLGFRNHEKHPSLLIDHLAFSNVASCQHQCVSVIHLSHISALYGFTCGVSEQEFAPNGALPKFHTPMYFGRDCSTLMHKCTATEMYSSSRGTLMPSSTSCYRKTLSD